MKVVRSREMAEPVVRRKHSASGMLRLKGGMFSDQIQIGSQIKRVLPENCSRKIAPEGELEYDICKQRKAPEL